MDDEKVEDNVIDIECINTVDNGDAVLIKDETTDNEYYDNDSFKISNDNPLGTGNLLSQFFNIIANIREKAYWKLDNSEIKSLNNTCPKILPAVIKEHARIISCALSLLSIILKRLKLEANDSKEQDTCNNMQDSVQEVVTEQTGLTGMRTE